ncbi:hypothetical protein WOLCODRAFT_20686 [Wolfiporia cocos MD-104 SS10]|uniref:Uncharacterized protein n=1 Tax=Wolfiporia cocos (strain MD-104) TaxID=742152 RepID=A0A2H3JJ26_WOLCO|nr:hypothetical protein WOLCODRAFT_20686 [Wolfiporia cocos MD-104 SS10]
MTIHAELEENSKQQQFELDALRHTHQQTLLLLVGTRTADLRDAQLYLTKTDSVSDAEILALVEQLNSEIFQAAAQISDSIDFDNVVHHTEPLLIESAKERIRPLVGEALVGLLGIVRHRDDPFCIQIALQASTVAFACKIIATWTFEPDDGKVSFNRVYTEIRHNERQGVSGRWRALTRLHTKAFLHPGDVMKTYLLERLTQYIVDIFAVSGFQVQGSPEASCAFLSNYHADRLKTLTESCLRLRQIIGEEVISGDFETLIVAPGEKFDGDHATDGYADPKADNSPTPCHRAPCTTAMGLQRVIQTGGTDSERALRPTILLKPVVALETLASELCQSSPAE